MGAMKTCEDGGTQSINFQSSGTKSRKMNRFLIFAIFFFMISITGSVDVVYVDEDTPGHESSSPIGRRYDYYSGGDEDFQGGAVTRIQVHLPLTRNP